MDQAAGISVGVFWSVYSQFCQLYRDWLARQEITLRQEHKAGQKLFVDFAGDSTQKSESSALIKRFIRQWGGGSSAFPVPTG